MAPATKRDPKPVERPPHTDGVPLPRNWGLMRGGIPYRPRDHPVQEDWGSVARKFDVGVSELIYFNFMTNESSVVNWYLRNYVGCVKVSPSGNNWMFSNKASPGVIYIPPVDHDPVDFEPEAVCVWMPNDAKTFMMRLFAISQGISGVKGKRIKALVQVILKAGYPACKDLWYYNDMAIDVYVDWNTVAAKHREMTKATGEAFPFDGDSGVRGQVGSEERHRGKWRIHPVNNLFDEFACGSWDAAAMRDRLESIDDEMYKGWHELETLAARSAGGGGSTYGPQVWEFINHVRLLIKDDSHLYSSFAP
jgi:hypothetical protein